MTKYFLLFIGSLLLMSVQSKKVKQSPDQLNIQAIRQIEIEQYDSAIVLFNELLKIDPTYPDAYYNRGGCKQFVGNHSGAIFDFDHAIKLNPKDEDCYYSRGLSKFEIKAFRGALQDFNKVIDLKPHYIEAFYDRAFCYKALDMNDHACADFHMAYDRGLKEAKKQFKEVCKK